MSLSYSTWQADSAPSRKRLPTMGHIAKRTIKARPQLQHHDSKNTDYEEQVADSSTYDMSTVADDMMNSSVAEPESFETAQSKQAERSAHVHQLLDNLTGVSRGGGGGELGDFNPMPYPPANQQRRIPKPVRNQIVADEPVHGFNSNNPLMPKTRATLAGPSAPEATTFRPAQSKNSDQFAIYRDAYNRESMVSGILGGGKPAASNNKTSFLSDDKVLEKLNYMTQMLEGLQMEKTNHVTEEFVLYCLLGVFIIYVVDGFSRGGKYVR